MLLNRFVEGFECDYVMVDYRQGGYLAATHLLGLGHRHILYQLGAPNHPPTRERLLGYCQALQEYGVAYDETRVIYTAQPFENYEVVMAAMQQLQPRPTAIMAYNDESAIPVLKALSDLGLRVPDDVSVVGQNDLSFAPFLIPPLTSIAQSVQEMGELGIRILLEKLSLPDGEEWRPQQVTLAPRPTLRQSSAPPRMAAQAV